MTKRKARPSDIGEICLSLPEVELGASWHDMPTYVVRGGSKSGMVGYRRPRKDAIDPETGEMYDDLLVIRVASEADKLALVEDESTPFFTTPHFNGYDAVLVQQSRLGEITREELVEVLTDAWRVAAPKRLVKAFDGG